MMMYRSPCARLLPLLLALSAPLKAQTAPGCPNGPADDKSIRVDATVAIPLHTLYQLSDSLLTAHGFRWTAASPVSARITAPRFTWPPGSENEPWHGAENPGLIITISAFTAHDSTRFSISSEVLCRISSVEVEPTDSSVESQLRVLGAMEMVTALTDALRQLGTIRRP